MSKKEFDLLMEEIRKLKEEVAALRMQIPTIQYVPYYPPSPQPPWNPYIYYPTTTTYTAG